MTNDQTPLNETPARASYECPVVIELKLTDGTEGKSNAFGSEVTTFAGPS